MRNKLVIIGAGGHGRVCAEIAKLCGYKDVIYLDDNPAIKENVYGTTVKLRNLTNVCDVFVAIGNNDVRSSFINKVKEYGGFLATLIHPFSYVSPDVVIGAGTVVMAGAVINNGAVIGQGTIVNTCSSIDHDCNVGDCSHVSVGAHLAGAVTMGEKTFVGAGATIINNITVCADAVIGAGATIVKDITEKGTYVGTPAKRVNY